MNYKEHYLKNWLVKKDALNYSKLEKNCKIPKNAIKHFINDAKTLSKKQISNLIDELLEYGYVPFY